MSLEQQQLPPGAGRALEMPRGTESEHRWRVTDVTATPPGPTVGDGFWVTFQHRSGALFMARLEVVAVTPEVDVNG